MREDPEWFIQANMAYAAFQNGILPCPGGLDQQPANFMPLMAIMTAAANAERDFEKRHEREIDAMVAESQSAPTQRRATPLR
ncbi:hypothetical protein RCKICKAPOO_46 [Rhodobacter phage RcKickapoo]|nr:hypothetical protein RCTIPTONUS_43 [Rhodobacter phage RcTiptonus]UUV43787.1 hypothetical protein RCKICKAPOO_46 [Rhodobacter phage RcKickapoo]UUV44414.1 hypothetical protein RCMENCHIE_45 [Rhodobacter phage RcMenchie]